MIPFRVKQVVRETSEAVTLVFEALTPELSYTPGQFLTFQIPFEGAVMSRSYSLSTTPYTDRYPAITVKKVLGGKISTYLYDHAREGQVFEATAPRGRFIRPPMRAVGRHLTLIAGGSGITPLFSILKGALFQERETKVSLIYANRHQEGIIYKDALDDLERRYRDRLQVIHILSQPEPSWLSHQGRLTPLLLRQLLEESGEAPAVDYLLCAPTGLMEMARTTLRSLGVAESYIHQEHFVPLPKAAQKKPFTYELKVNYLGQQYTCHPSNDQTVLEAALEAGADLPYACMSGTCNTCRAKCVRGSVKMEEDEGLSEQEIEDGYVLTCVSRATSEKVEIDV